jgi:hypothetical protein
VAGWVAKVDPVTRIVWYEDKRNPGARQWRLPGDVPVSIGSGGAQSPGGVEALLRSSREASPAKAPSWLSHQHGEGPSTADEEGGEEEDPVDEFLHELEDLRDEIDAALKHGKVRMAGRGLQVHR